MRFQNYAIFFQDLQGRTFEECPSIYMHVFSLCKTRSNAAMRFCTCHGAGNIIETLHNLGRNNISGLIFIWIFNYLFKQVVLNFY